MNIFAVSADPLECAAALDNRRLVKMVLETAQMLSTVLSALDPGNPAYYKATHINHPCTRWVRADDAHRHWTSLLFWAYGQEYSRRFDRPHASIQRLDASVRRHYRPGALPSQWCNCTPFPELPVFQAYRLTLLTKWQADADTGKPPRWTKSQPPHWMDLPHGT